MRSVPGGGKSFKAKQLAGDEGVIFSTDEFWGKDLVEYRENWDKASSQGRTGPLLGYYHKLNFERSEKAMEEGLSPIIIDNTNVKIRDMRPYVEAGINHGYDVEFAEPDSKWWKKIQPLLRKKEANVKELKRAADLLAERNEHGVPAEVIYKMMEKWHPDITLDDF